ncbi:MAG: SpoIIE family protein phosphatase [Firmicutes bacterium]|nr:SpoIIE family protein phosphatase [Bacillota bacterium]
MPPKSEKAIQYEVGFSSHKGTIKELNEDNYCAERREDDDGHSSALIAVSDGVGGFSLGEIASKIAINHMEKFFKLGEFKQMYDEAEILEPHRVIQELYTRINHIILSLAEKENRMVGCTLTSGFFNGDSLYVASVGSSKAYLIRNGMIKKLTEEQLLEPLAKVKLNHLTSDETLDPSGKTSYLNALGSDISMKAEVKHLQVKEEDIILFCSDGLYNQVGEMDIAQAAVQNPSMQAFCNELIDRANTAGGKDNVTVVAIKILKEKKSLRNLLGGKGKGKKSSPVLLIVILLAVFLALGAAFFLKSYIFKESKQPNTPVKPRLHAKPSEPKPDLPRSFNSLAVESELPMKYVLVNGQPQNLTKDGTVFDFKTDKNLVKIMPNLRTQKLYTITLSGLNRNLSVVQSKTNEIMVENEKVTVMLTAGSKVDFIAKEEYTGSKFLLNITHLGSPMEIQLMAEEEISIKIKSDDETTPAAKPAKPAEQPAGTSAPPDKSNNL